MLTEDQATALAADAKAEDDKAFVDAYTNQVGAATDFMAAWYNAPVEPETPIWRRDVSADEIRAVVVWAEYVALSVAQQNACLFLLPAGNRVYVDFTSPEMIQGVSSVFSGKVTLTAILALAKRPASRFEALFLSEMEGASVSSAYGLVLTATDVGVALYGDDGEPK